MYRTPQQNQKKLKFFLVNLQQETYLCVHYYSTTREKIRRRRLCINIFDTQGEEEAQKIKGIAWNKKKDTGIYKGKHVDNTRSNNKFERQKRIDHSLHKIPIRVLGVVDIRCGQEKKSDKEYCGNNVAQEASNNGTTNK